MRLAGVTGLLSYTAKEKKILMKSIDSDSTLTECDQTFNRNNAMSNAMKKTRESLFLHLFRTNAESDALVALRSETD